MTALVTGASGGLGRAIAVALAHAGHDVAVHFRGDAPGAETTAAAVRAYGRRAATLMADFAVEDSGGLDALCERLLEQATTALGPVDVVVLNAFPQDVTAWSDLTSADWDAMHRGGLRPTAALLHAAGRRLGPGGVIVTIGSIEGFRAAPGHAPYAVAKAALHHLTAAAAAELGAAGIRVVGVAPGLIARAGLAEEWPEGVARWRSAAALRREVRAEEVAGVVAFLASAGASGITGATIPVDAGWTAAPGW